MSQENVKIRKFEIQRLLCMSYDLNGLCMAKLIYKSLPYSKYSLLYLPDAETTKFEHFRLSSVDFRLRIQIELRSTFRGFIDAIGPENVGGA